MRIWKFLKIAIVSLYENKVRSVLTMLGVIIGIGSVVLMTSIGKGVEASILFSVESFGSRSIFVQPGGGTRGGPPSLTAIDKLKYKDYLAVKELDYLENVTPILVLQARTAYLSESLKNSIVGTNSQYEKSLNISVDKGRFLSEADIDGGRRVAVLGYKVVDQLFGDQDPIGKRVKIKNREFEVIGVMSPQGQRFFQDFDKRVLMPISTMRNQIYGVDFLQSIIANVKGDVDEAIEDLRAFIRKRHTTNFNPDGDPNKDDFRVVSQVDAVDSFREISTVLTLFLVLIASISLLVGGIGIMNIMLVSVSERTMEIGLRKAVGATDSDILLQFLIEAVVVTVLGGVLGVFGGIGISYVVSVVIQSFQMRWDFIVPFEAVLVSMVVTFFVGLLFGIYPAKNASKMSPIEALRSE